MGKEMGKVALVGEGNRGFLWLEVIEKIGSPSWTLFELWPLEP